MDAEQSQKNELRKTNQLPVFNSGFSGVRAVLGLKEV